MTDCCALFDPEYRNENKEAFVIHDRYDIICRYTERSMKVF